MGSKSCQMGNTTYDYMHECLTLPETRLISYIHICTRQGGLPLATYILLCIYYNIISRYNRKIVSSSMLDSS